MKKLLLLLLMLLASPVSAATFNWNSNKPSPTTIWPCDVVQTVSNGGITATFGPWFAYNPINPPGIVEDLEWPGFHVSGLFRPESHGNWSVFMDTACPTPPEGFSYAIEFNPPIKYFAVDIMGTMTGHVWTRPYWVCSTDNGVSWNTHCMGGTAGDFGSLSYLPRVYMADANYTVRATEIPSPIDGWDGCGTDPPSQSSPSSPNFNWSNNARPFCNWQRIQLYSTTPIKYVWFIDFWATNWFSPLYLDNFVASTLICPNSPCEIRATEPRVEGVSVAEPIVEQRPPMPQQSVVLLNTVTGERVMVGEQVTGVRRSSWGRIKSLYR
jgi:hypothetical protein